MRKLIAFAATALAAAAVASTPVASTPPPPPPPRLVIVISVDQLAADVFDEYRTRFTGGLARLSRGTVFRNGYQAHAATETCPGHSTLLTGRHPANNGIVANSWIDQSIAREDKSVYCAEDETKPRPSGPSSFHVSPVHLRAPTLGELIKQAAPGSLNVAVAAKDRAAVMMSGHRADQRWYWDGKQFITDLRQAAAPAVVARTNAALAAAIAAPREALVPPPYCQSKSTPVAVSNALTVGNHRFARAAGDARAFRNSPEMDAATLALAAGLVQELGLGRDAAPDILSIGLSATDYVGHSYGPGGGEMCLHLLSLDRDLGDFFALLDRQRIDYAVVVTADHGVMDIPERLRAKSVPQAARADPGLAPFEIGKKVAEQFGLKDPALKGEGIGGDVWLDRAVPAAIRDRVARTAMQLYMSHPQVHGVFYRPNIISLPMPAGDPSKWTVFQRVRASYDPSRSGDFYVVLKEHVSPVARPAAGYVATHGTPWDHDRRVPILFWRPGMAAATRNEPVSTVDILPTLQALLGLASRQRLDGRCLAGIQGIICRPL